MTDEQLPEWLQLAIHIAQQECLRNMTIGAPEAWNEEILAAIDAIRDEYTKRVTLQRHATDQAQRIADLEEERDEVEEDRDELRNERDKHIARIDRLETKVDTIKRLHDAAVDERDAAREVLRHIRYHANRHELDRTWLKVADDVLGTFRAPRRDAVVLAEVHDVVIAERDRLRAKLAGIEGQEPVAYLTDDGKMLIFADQVEHAGAMHPLYARPVPAIPDGWRLVPVEPTPEMLTAAARASMQHLIDCINDPARAAEVGSEEMCKRTHGERYKSMLAAAPEAAK